MTMLRKESRQRGGDDSTQHLRADLAAGPAGGMEKGPMTPAEVLLAERTLSRTFCEGFPDLGGTGKIHGRPYRSMEEDSGSCGVAHGESPHFLAQGIRSKPETAQVHPLGLYRTEILLSIRFVLHRCKTGKCSLRPDHLVDRRNPAKHAGILRFLPPTSELVGTVRSE